MDPFRGALHGDSRDDGAAKFGSRGALWITVGILAAVFSTATEPTVAAETEDFQIVILREQGRKFHVPIVWGREFTTGLCGALSAFPTLDASNSPVKHARVPLQMHQVGLALISTRARRRRSTLIEKHS